MGPQATRSDAAGGPAGDSGTDTAHRLVLVRLVIAMRDKRDTFLGGDIFADPAWDILLDLYATELAGRQMSISDACVGARVPQTTALRWIEKLQRDGMIERESDTRDGRRSLLRLSRERRERLDQLFDWLSLRVDGGARSNRSSIRPSGV